MAITQATSLADFSTGIGTAGAVLQVDNADGRVGIGTTDPQGTLQVGIAITMDGTAGVITASSFSGSGANLTFTGADISAATGTFTGNVSVGGTLTYEDVTNVDSVGVITARSGVRVTGGDIQAGDSSTGFSGTVIFGFSTTTSGNAGTIQAKNFGSGGANFVGFDAAGNDTARILTDGGALFASDVSIADKIIHTGDTNTAIRFPAADTFTVETAGSEAIRVDSSRRLLIGATSAVTAPDDKVQINSTTGVGIHRGEAGTAGPRIDLTKSRNATHGSNTIVQSGDLLGSIFFRGDDGTDYNSSGAQILCQVDGTPGADDMPGRLVFSTTADGSSSPTERMRIDSAGKLFTDRTVSNTTGNHPAVEINTDSTGTAANSFATGIDFQTEGTTRNRLAVTTNNNWIFYRDSGSNEALRIDSAGDVGIGTISPSNMLHIEGSSPSIRLKVTSGPRHMISPFSGDLYIESDVDNASASTNTIFTVDGSEHMRINSSGKILIGSGTESALNDRLLQVGKTDRSSTYVSIVNSTSGVGGLLFADSTGSGNGGYRGQIDYIHSSDAMRLYTAAAERLRIASSGQIGLGGANYGTSGQVITSNGSGSAPTWQDAAGGSWNLISTVNASSSSSVAFTSVIDNTYKQYVIVGTEITTDATGNPDIVFRFKSGSTTKTASDYFHAITRSTNSAGPTRIAGTGQSRAKVTGCQFTSSTNYSRAYFQLWMTGDNNSLGHMTYTEGATMYSSSNMQRSSGAQGYAGQEASAFVVDGIEFFLDTGDNMTGTFKLYGLA